MRPALPANDLDLVLSLTPTFWRRFAGARIFVTGGTGFIGAWLLEAVQHANRELACGMKVMALSRNPAAAQAMAPHLFNDPAFKLLAGDVRNFSAPISSQAGRFDLCVHAASDVGDLGKAGQHRDVFDSAVSGTRRVLDFAVDSGVKRFLLTSSGAVYGVQPPELDKIPEIFTGAPDALQVNAAYGNGKRAAEWLSVEAAASTGMEVVVARIFALLGPGLPLDGPFAAGNFIRDALRGEPIHIHGDGRPVRSYLYAADACAWLLRLLESGESGQAYNLGSESALSIAELAGEVGHATGNLHPASLPRPLPVEAAKPAAAPRYVPDTRKARQQLGLAQHTPFESALKKTIEWNRTAMQA